MVWALAMARALARYQGSLELCHQLLYHLLGSYHCLEELQFCRFGRHHLSNQ